MRILAIDSAAGSQVGIYENGTPIAVENNINPRGHAEFLGPALTRVLAAAGDDIDLVVAGRGPGPFTGLRAGLITAKVFAYARRLPLWGLSSLEALAVNASQSLTAGTKAEVVVSLDARRKEVFWAHYEIAPQCLPRLLAGPATATPNDLAQEITAPWAGPGAALYPQDIPLTPAYAATAAYQLQGLADLAGLYLKTGQTLENAEFPATALYLRRPDIHGGAGTA